MCPVEPTASFTHDWTRLRLEAWRRCVRLAVLALLTLSLGGTAWARDIDILLSEVHHDADGVALSVRLAASATPVEQDALLKGVPLYIVWEAELTRSRWYWTDKTVATAVRTYRLAYQPLTRRWRLSLANDGQTGQLGTGLMFPLHQSYDSLEAAVAVIGRVSRWRIAPASRIDPDDRYRLAWRFRLDLGLLPRPFQLGMINQPGWNLASGQRLAVPPPSDGPEAREAGDAPEAGAETGAAPAPAPER